MGRTPTRATAIRQEAEPAAPKHGKTRIRKNASQRSMLDMEGAIIEKLRLEFGVDVQWVTDSVLGKAEPAIRQDFEINAWEPVTQDMFGGIFDGMYMRKGQGGEIQYNGLVLMWRPYELTIEARQEEQSARIAAMRAQENMIKGGAGIQGLAPGFESDHHTAVRGNVFHRSMEIPTE